VKRTYDEFRRIAAHSLVFEETLIADYKSIPRPEDINDGFDKGLRWRLKPNGHYDLTRLKLAAWLSRISTRWR
jgi:hypothetical protein